MDRGALSMTQIAPALNTSLLCSNNAERLDGRPMIFSATNMPDSKICCRRSTLPKKQRRFVGRALAPFVRPHLRSIKRFKTVIGDDHQRMGRPIPAFRRSFAPRSPALSPRHGLRSEGGARRGGAFRVGHGGLRRRLQPPSIAALAAGVRMSNVSARETGKAN